MPPSVVELNGSTYLKTPQGLKDLKFVAGADLMRDQLVRELFATAEAVHRVIKDFKTRAFTEIQTFQALVDEKYGASASPGGDKGNVTLKTIDGTIQVIVQVADLIRFESTALQSCRKLVEECIGEWAAGSQAELRQIVMNAFRVDKAGEINTGALLSLLRLEITEPRWVQAMTALKDSITVDASKVYIRVQSRPTPESPWISLSLNVATA